MCYGSPTSTQLSPTSPVQDDREFTRPMRMRRQRSRERYRQRGRSPYPQPRSDLYPRRSPPPERYQERSNHRRGDSYRPETSFTSTFASSPRTQTRSSSLRGTVVDHPYRGPPPSFSDLWPQRSSVVREAAWDPRSRDSPPRRDSEWAGYNPFYPTPLWAPRDRDYHPAWLAPEPRTPSPPPPSVERPKNARPATTPCPLGELDPEVEENIHQRYTPHDDRTPTPNSPVCSESSDHHSDVLSDDSPDDELLLERHRSLIPLDEANQRMRNELVLVKCKLTDPEKCYHLYTTVEDLSCPEAEAVDAARFMRTYFVYQLGQCDAELWINAKHKLHGIVPRGDMDTGYDYDKEYEDDHGGRVCCLSTRCEDAERIGLRYKVWTTEERLW